MEVNLQLIINYEFERFILSYAENVKVVKPKKIADAIAVRLENAQMPYF